jgi:hypothetical protein
VSNVLIGIIGVILFIGLALAGALFLGPRFQESTNNSKAAAVVQSVSQIAHAANLYEVSEGTPYVSSTSETTGVDGLIAAKYIKSRPTNPVTSVNGVQYGGLVLSDTGVFAGRGGWAVMPLNDGEASNSTEAVRVCRAIAQQNGQTLPADGSAPLAASPSATGRQVGCMRASALWGVIAPDRIVAFARI